MKCRFSNRNEKYPKKIYVADKLLEKGDEWKISNYLESLLRPRSYNAPNNKKWAYLAEIA